MKGGKTIKSDKENALSVSGSDLSIKSLQIIIVMGFSFFLRIIAIWLLASVEIIDSGSFNILHLILL